MILNATAEMETEKAGRPTTTLADFGGGRSVVGSFFFTGKAFLADAIICVKKFICRGICEERW
jgi:hypothetical protein